MRAWAAGGPRGEPAVGAGQRGSGTVAVLVAVLVVWAFGLLGVAVAQALTVRHQVAAAADLAALAGADAVRAGSRGACGAAGRVAAANAAVLTSCAVQGAVVDVLVERRVRCLGRSVDVRARARAGPAVASDLSRMIATVEPAGRSGAPA